MIFYDKRWIGEHGIGRFACMINRYLEFQTLKVCGKPSSPLDLILFSFAMLKLPLHSTVFSPGYNAPLLISRRFVFTIHDLNHIDRPENKSILKGIYYRIVMRRACRNADHVLTVSEFSRQRIIAWAQVNPDHVVNVGNGVDDRYHPTVLPFSPGYPYLLCVSNRKAHKNEPMVVRAFGQAQIDCNIRLIFTGPASKKLVTLARSLGVEDRVIFTGRVSEEALPGLYRGALALVFPSLYEGFGLPVIEAMACGTPVLTSNTTSLPEVAGDAALLVDPYDTEAISDGITRIVNDNDLRSLLSTRGIEQSKKYSWEATAERVKQVLELNASD